jgi:hypothetical protein
MQIDRLKDAGEWIGKTEAPDETSWAELQTQRTQMLAGDDAFSDVSDDELAQRVTEALEQLSSLQAAADGAERRAQAAEKAFRADPTAAAHTEAAVQRQLAENAQARLREAETGSARLVAEHELRIKRRRFQQLQERADRTALLGAAHARLRELLASVRAEMEGIGQKLLADIHARDAAAAELAPLAAELKAVVNAAPLDFGAVCVELSTRLQPELAPRPGRHYEVGALTGGMLSDGRHTLNLSLKVPFAGPDEGER